MAGSPRSRCLALAVAAGLAGLGAVVAGAQAPALTEAQALQAQVQVLKEQLFQAQADDAQCHANLADVTARLQNVTLNAQGAALQESRRALEAEIRKALGGKDGDEVDWATSPPSLKPSAAQPAQKGQG
jgi:hypothetical protein